MSWLGNDDAPPTRPSGRRSTARTPSASFSNRRGPQAPAPTPTDPSSVPKAILTQARTTGRLNLSDRDLAEIPEDVWALSEPEQPSGPVDFSKAGYSSPEFTELLRFTAANNLLTSLDPRIVSAFPQLTYLDLRNNRLSQLPLELGELEALSIVHLTSNAFDHIPAAILSLPALTELSMPANAISTIGPGIRQLQLLQTLDLSSNALTVLPEDLGSLFSLRTLNLSRNHLTHLPGRTFVLSTLTTLILRDNKVTTLDPEACTSLRTLDMANNELTSLPPRLGLCPNLRQVSVDGNRFRIPRRDILDRGSDALLEWLRARA
ncbi:hypothetical protein BJ684DRAFT_7022 [Piptocephalis cylindrospora]|uniref:Leucine-rich repeat-containing protein 40 n=1 Tax=Piptocephalis cylindrospora TaxID=1907219 RepID=A0A4P9Y8D9_9FUNG|nr:hypothetical protein BJ684DRAFT_7022 [Piptocephalis cylindrospora]|eukprot:RKP15427.1 hypothetical protein BJ684DRAFT_7022 [Piptocephalis cylindrospora]